VAQILLKPPFQTPLPSPHQPLRFCSLRRRFPLAQPVETLLLQRRRNSFALVVAPRPPRVGGCLRRPQSPPPRSRPRQPDPHGRRPQVLLRHQRALLHHPCPASRPRQARVGRGSAHAAGDVPLLPRIDEVQSLRWRRQGLLLRQEDRESRALGPVCRRREGVAVDRKPSREWRRTLPRVCV